MYKLFQKGVFKHRATLTELPSCMLACIHGTGNVTMCPRCDRQALFPAQWTLQSAVGQSVPSHQEVKNMLPGIGGM